MARPADSFRVANSCANCKFCFYKAPIWEAEFYCTKDGEYKDVDMWDAVNLSPEETEKYYSMVRSCAVAPYGICDSWELKNEIDSCG